VPFIFGITEEVERIEQYHRENNDPTATSPLYGSRGLFRTTTVG
jgi:fructose-1,6-bisphosphatase I/sedoheptulose-1,7-bisphosphatase